MVWSDNSHPLYGQLRSQLIPRGSGRLGLPYAGTNRHPASFITKPAYEVQLQEEADCKEAVWCNLVI